MKTKLFLSNNVSRLQVVVLVGLFLTACGQKGALYSPDSRSSSAVTEQPAVQINMPDSKAPPVTSESAKSQ